MLGESLLWGTPLAGGLPGVMAGPALDTLGLPLPVVSLWIVVLQREGWLRKLGTLP